MENITDDFNNLSSEERVSFRKYLEDNEIYYGSDDIRWALAGSCECNNCLIVVNLYNMFRNKNNYIEEDE